MEPPSIPASTVPEWPASARLAFRFSTAYIALYLAPVFPKSLVAWVAIHLFGVSRPAVAMTGSGDRTVDWASACCVLALAVVITIVWTTVDRRRRSYVALLPWMRLWVRFSLGSAMVGYGLMKVIPVQMSAPQLVRLLEPFGNFSPMGVLWSFIGASPGYERFAGATELVAGLLLFVPPTALVGALFAFAVTSHIFVLNMTYDVPVKLYSFHLMLLSLFLLAPDARRLANVLLLNRTADPSSQPSLGRTPRRRHLWLAAQIVVGIVITTGSFSSAWHEWNTSGGGAPRSALYGIWNVEEMSIDGVAHPPLLDDRDRWRRVIFDRPDSVLFQRADDTSVFANAAIDETGRWITIVPPGSRATPDRLTFHRPAAGELILDGEMTGRKIYMRLSRFDTTPLTTRGFHWIQEAPFNR